MKLLGIVFVVCCFLTGETSNSQVVTSNSDLSAEIKTFDDYTHDLQAAVKAAQTGEDIETTVFLENMASVVDERLISIRYSVQIYRVISAKTDREKAKSLVKEQLGLNAYLINSDTDRIAGMLSFVKIPAIAQTGLKMKDDMRAAKEKLDGIASSLE